MLVKKKNLKIGQMRDIDNAVLERDDIKIAQEKLK